MTLVLIAVAAVLAAPSGNFDHQHAQLDGVLKEYVVDGLVDYRGLKENRTPLDDYLMAAGSVPISEFQGWSPEEQLAFLINVYNGTTLQFIIDAYPVDSIKSLGSLLSSPWGKKTVLLFGKKLSLDTLEHKIIRKNYEEPRVHFALVCAALGCPELRNEAYTASQLEAQLENQARNFLNSEEKNRVEPEKKCLSLSSIFRWYRKDFEKDSESVAAFVVAYMAEPGTPKDVWKDYRLCYTKYDWALNVQPLAKGGRE